MSESSESIPVVGRRTRRPLVAGLVMHLLAVVAGAWLWLRHGWSEALDVF
jgi:hypothetical protein